MTGYGYYENKFKRVTKLAIVPKVQPLPASQAMAKPLQTLAAKFAASYGKHRIAG